VWRKGQLRHRRGVRGNGLRPIVRRSRVPVKHQH
jgi:hypothetical protein